MQSDVTLAYGLDPLLVHANIISIRSPVFGDLVEAARERERRILCGTGSVIANYLKDLDVEGKATAHMDMIRSHVSTYPDCFMKLTHTNVSDCSGFLL